MFIYVVPLIRMKHIKTFVCAISYWRCLGRCNRTRTTLCRSYNVHFFVNRSELVLGVTCFQETTSRCSSLQSCVSTHVLPCADASSGQCQLDNFFHYWNQIFWCKFCISRLRFRFPTIGKWRAPVTMLPKLFDMYGFLDASFDVLRD